MDWTLSPKHQTFPWQPSRWRAVLRARAGDPCSKVVGDRPASGYPNVLVVGNVLKEALESTDPAGAADDAKMKA